MNSSLFNSYPILLPTRSFAFRAPLTTLLSPTCYMCHPQLPTIACPYSRSFAHPSIATPSLPRHHVGKYTTPYKKPATTKRSCRTWMPSRFLRWFRFFRSASMLPILSLNADFDGDEPDSIRGFATCFVNGPHGFLSRRVRSGLWLGA